MKNATPMQAERYWLRTARSAPVEKTVETIVADVRRRGEAAVRAWTKKLDGSTRKDLHTAGGPVPAELRRAINTAARRIQRFAKAQRKSLTEFTLRAPGEALSQRVIPVVSAGAYVPGGRFPLLSTALMTVIPAKVAGVERVVVCTPPRPDGTVAPEIVYAAEVAGADAVFAVGGAQAIAAMAYGAGPIGKADVVVGPGNRYVAAAKALVSRDVRIDAMAGPSELLVIAEGQADPAMIAMELLAQAEHDPDARVALLCTSAALIRRVNRAMAEARMPALARRIATAPAVKVGSVREAVRLSDRLAPEHLSLQVRHGMKVAGELKQYGSLFVGPNARVALGDYLSGPNHTLPTGGTARFRGGLSVFDFVKVQTVQSFNVKAFGRLSRPARLLAGAEGLTAHERSLGG